MSNHHPNGTLTSGAQGSYKDLIAGLEDLLKGKPKVFEVHHFKVRIVEAGRKAGMTIPEMEKDAKPIFDAYNERIRKDA